MERGKRALFQSLSLRIRSDPYHSPYFPCSLIVSNLSSSPRSAHSLAISSLPDRVQVRESPQGLLRSLRAGSAVLCAAQSITICGCLTLLNPRALFFSLTVESACRLRRAITPLGSLSTLQIVGNFQRSALYCFARVQFSQWNRSDLSLCSLSFSFRSDDHCTLLFTLQYLSSVDIVVKYVRDSHHDFRSIISYRFCVRKLNQIPQGFNPASDQGTILPEGSSYLDSPPVHSPRETE